MQAHWASPFFKVMMELGHQGVQRYLNRPEAQALRGKSRSRKRLKKAPNMARERSFYVVLCVRNFHRGAPMIPSDQGITINQGSRHGFATWRRFCDEKFRLADYLPHFLEKIGCRQAV